MFTSYNSSLVIIQQNTATAKQTEISENKVKVEEIIKYRVRNVIFFGQTFIQGSTYLITKLSLETNFAGI